MQNVSAHACKRRTLSPSLYRYLLAETRGFCSMCHEAPVQEVHHIKPVSEGGQNFYDNLIPLCADCHKRVHLTGVSDADLLSLKSGWITKNRLVLARIVRRRHSPYELARSLAENYFRVADKIESRRFKTRLAKMLNAQELFRNLAWIRQHRIKKNVDGDGNCWTEEYQKLSSFWPTRYRTVEIRGDGPATQHDNQFAARVTLNGRELPIAVSCVSDDAHFKLYKLSWGEALPAGQMFEVECRYFWPCTWNLPEDVYSYDVLSWIDSLVYDFCLPRQFAVESVRSSFIDVFDRQTTFRGRAAIRSNRFSWEGSRLPLFSSVIIKYRAKGRVALTASQSPHQSNRNA